MSERKKRNQGFTLIELLVVISIIGVLSTIVLAGLNSARMKSRDTTRMGQLGQIRTALELYYDTNGYYPQSSCGWDCNGYRVSYDGSWDLFAADLKPYISSLPKDPVNSACPPWGTGCYSYAYGNVGRTTQRGTYDLTAQLEDPGNPQRCGLKNWKFYFTSVPWCTAFGGAYSNQVYEASID